MKKILIERNIADEAWFEKVHKEQETILQDGFDRAIAAERPSKEECVNYNNLYSNDEGGAL